MFMTTNPMGEPGRRHRIECPTGIRIARQLARLGGVAVLLLSLTSGIVHARDFTVVGWGGATQEAVGGSILRPFAKTRNTEVLEDVYLGGWGVFQAMKDTGQVPWDVVQVESSELARGCEEGVFLPLDWSRIADPSLMTRDAVSECGVGVSVWSSVVAFNPGTVGARPRSLADFWDLEKWPGKRGLRQGPKINLEMALMADGVSPGDVYQVLDTPGGVERAFRKLDELKGALRLWKSGGQSQDLLLSGEVVMSTSYNSRVIRGRENGLDLDLIWDGAVYAVDSFAILAKSPHVDLAYEFLKRFVEYESHVELLMRTHNTVPIRHVLDSLEGAMREARPLDENIESALFMGSRHGVDFWLNNQEALTRRWNTWVAQD